MTSLSQTSLFLSSLRYLTMAQVWHRARRIALRRFRQLTNQAAPRPQGIVLKKVSPLYAGLGSAGLQELEPEAVRAAIGKARAARDLRFCFLNLEVSFPEKVDWNHQKLSQLWRYHLHYFDYVRDLLVLSAAGEQQQAFSIFKQLAVSWIENNRVISGDGWHPYTISLRIVNWLHGALAFEGELQSDSSFREMLLSSIYGQARVLASGIELDVRGNHLIENIRALVWAGMSFEGAEPRGWLQRGLELLAREVPEQIAPDGGHFERSPGYHLVVLRDLLEIAVFLGRNGVSISGYLDDALRRMVDYLFSILAPDGQLPMLKDTVRRAQPAPFEVIAAGAIYFEEPAFKRTQGLGLYPLLLFGKESCLTFEGWPMNDAPRTSRALTSSGHFVFRDDPKQDYLIFDAGKTCPDYLPAHAHADLLSYELMMNSRWVVVDSGVFEYTAGRWRDYFRSTRAHNTVEIDNQNQSEVWSSFRVARRAHPLNVRYGIGPDWSVVQAEHDGYNRLEHPTLHRRTLVWVRGRFWLVLDELMGKGRIDARSFVHFHPSLSLSQLKPNVWIAEGQSERVWITVFGQQNAITLRGIQPAVQGWYSEEQGIVEPNSVLSLERVARPPFCYGYAISVEPGLRIQGRNSDEAFMVTITGNHWQHSVALRNNLLPQIL